MKKEILRNFLKRLFNRLNENVTTDREEGEWQKAFFDAILNADWVLPDLEKEDLPGNLPDEETNEKSETQNNQEPDVFPCLHKYTLNPRSDMHLPFFRSLLP